MELNHECVRDLMPALETVPYLDREITTDQIFKNAGIGGKYDINELNYTFVELIDAKFVDGKQVGQRPTLFGFTKITYEGHKFLDNIKDESVWKQTKKTIFSKAASASLSVFSSVAAKVLEDKFNL